MIWFKAVTLASIIVLALAVWDFSWRAQSTALEPSEPEIAVAFTGQYSRVTHALHLLEIGEVQYLFISGVNRGAGMAEETFVEKFTLSGTLRHALETGKLALGTRAHTTLQNAEETRCWLNQRDHTGSILLITSPDHMPRASLALEAMLPGIEIWRAAVPEDYNRMTAPVLMVEFAKYLATYALAYAPRWEPLKAC